MYSFLLERILQLNAFGCPLSTREIYLSRMKMETKKFDEYFHFCGIWRMASYINHSCIRTPVGHSLVM